MARQRRHNQRRKNRGRFRGLYKILSILLVLAAITAACIVFFRVQTVYVEGAGRYTQEEIIHASGLETGDYLALLDTGRIAHRLRAQLPYIERAQIRRILPDTVVITVEESTVAAALQNQDQWWLVNAAGKLLESVPPEQAQAYPALTGFTLLTPAAGLPAIVADEEINRWNCALELLSALEERGELSRLNALDCSLTGQFTARYDQKYTLLLPTTIEYQYVTRERFDYFLALLDEALPQVQEEGQDIIDFTQWETTGRIYARPTR